jgi:hypothetical protein
MADPKKLGQALYELMDTIQHDWHGREISLSVSETHELVLGLIGCRQEINLLLDRLEAQNAKGS